MAASYYSATSSADESVDELVDICVIDALNDMISSKQIRKSEVFTENQDPAKSKALPIEVNNSDPNWATEKNTQGDIDNELLDNKAKGTLKTSKRKRLNMKETDSSPKAISKSYKSKSCTETSPATGNLSRGDGAPPVPLENISAIEQKVIQLSLDLNEVKECRMIELNEAYTAGLDAGRDHIDYLEDIIKEQAKRIQELASDQSCMAAFVHKLEMDCANLEQNSSHLTHQLKDLKRKEHMYRLHRDQNNESTWFQNYCDVCQELNKVLSDNTDSQSRANMLRLQVLYQQMQIMHLENRLSNLKIPEDVKYYMKDISNTQDGSNAQDGGDDQTKQTDRTDVLPKLSADVIDVKGGYSVMSDVIPCDRGDYCLCQHCSAFDDAETESHGIEEED